MLLIIFFGIQNVGGIAEVWNRAVAGGRVAMPEWVSHFGDLSSKFILLWLIAVFQFHLGFDDETNILEHDSGQFLHHDVECLFRSEKCAANHSIAVDIPFETSHHPVYFRHVLHRVSFLFHWHHHVRLLLRLWPNSSKGNLEWMQSPPKPYTLQLHYPWIAVGEQTGSIDSPFCGRNGGRYSWHARHFHLVCVQCVAEHSIGCPEYIGRHFVHWLHSAIETVWAQRTERKAIYENSDRSTWRSKFVGWNRYWEMFVQFSSHFHGWRHMRRTHRWRLHNGNALSVGKSTRKLLNSNSSNTYPFNAYPLLGSLVWRFDKHGRAPHHHRQHTNWNWKWAASLRISANVNRWM